MHIWLDGQCLQTASRARGIGRFVHGMIAALAAMPDIRLTVSCNAQLPEDHLSLPKGVTCRRWQGATVAGELFSGDDARRRLSELALAHHVACINPDVAISTSLMEGMQDGAVPFRKIEGFAIPSVVVFHDAIPHRFPQFYLTTHAERTAYQHRLARYADFDAALCLSDFTASEIRALFPAVPAHVVSAGFDTAIFNMQARQLPRPATVAAHARYILCAGGFDAHKNVAILPAAWAALPEAIRDQAVLVLAGAASARTKSALQRAWRAAGLVPSRLIFTGHVSDAELAQLYLHAALMVQPSRMEGFGFTVLEAMACGAPLAVARAGALPELVGRDELMFDPAQADQLADMITRALTDEGWRADASVYVLERSRLFNWADTGAHMVAAFKSVPRTGGGYATIEVARAWAAPLARAISLRSDVIIETMAVAEGSPGQP
jgi:glycosyltransferase involved in cell wall biosynthesis